MTKESCIKLLLDFDKKYDNEHEEPIKPEDIKSVQHIFTATDILEGDISVKETFCEEVNCKARKTTNADKIRYMADEELAKFLIYSEVTEEVWYYTPDGDRFDCFESAIKHTLNWLKTEIK